MKRILKFLTSIKKIDYLYDQVTNDYKNPKMIMGKLLAHNLSKIDVVQRLSDVEFQVFSQWGDDGIIQYLISKIDFPNRTFIEFGVENYKESNTRFLLLNNNWSGLVLDGSKQCVEFIQNDSVTWTHELFAKHAFITKENINGLLQKEFLDKGFHKEVGILSVDIDGNDYWVWNEINVIDPIVVIVEYNSFFSDNRAISIPYSANFVMTSSKPYYWGASLNAFCHLAEIKGYDFVGCNSNGNNAYFIKKNKIGSMKALSSEQGFVQGKFRMNFKEDGSPFTSKEIREGLIGHSVINVIDNNDELL